MMRSELSETVTVAFDDANHELFLLAHFARENSSRDCIIQSKGWGQYFSFEHFKKQSFFV